MKTNKAGVGGGGDGHEGVNWEFLLILLLVGVDSVGSALESIKGILTSSPFSQTFQSMAAFEI